MPLVVRSEGLNTGSNLRIIDRLYPQLNNPELDTELLNIVGKINDLYTDILTRLGVVTGRIDANIPQTLPIRGAEGALIIGQGEADALYKEVTGEVTIDKDGITSIVADIGINTVGAGDISRDVNTQYVNDDKNRLVIVTFYKDDYYPTALIDFWVSIGGNTIGSSPTEGSDLKKVGHARTVGTAVENDSKTVFGIIPPNGTYRINVDEPTRVSIGTWSETDLLH